MTQNNNRNASSAARSSLGYNFQDVYSLYLLLKQEKHDLNLWVEGLDDIHIRDNDDHLTLYQLKDKAENLNNKNPGLWNTLGNWCQAIQDKDACLEKTEFKLVITAELLSNQLAYSLNKEYGYNPSKAYDKLYEIAKNEPKKENKDPTKPKTGYEKFLDFLPDEKERKLFVSKIEVLDKSRNAEELNKAIPSMLHAYPEHQNDVYMKIRGWWQIKLDEQKSDNNPTPLTKTALINEIAKASEDYGQNSLPEDDNADRERYPLEKEQLEKANFVQHFKKITKIKKRIDDAMFNFFRAKNRRVEWATKRLLVDNELENYETDLIEHWEGIVTELVDLKNFEVDCSDDLKKEFGLNVYTETKKQYVRPLREKMTKAYVKMGSYHILVDEDRLCWYPEGVMLELLETI